MSAIYDVELVAGLGRTAATGERLATGGEPGSATGQTHRGSVSRFEPQQTNSLRIYLCRAVENRIRDEQRRAARRRGSIAPGEVVRFSVDAAPQHRQLVDDETWRRYLNGLKRLTARDRRLIVGRAELGYSYRQLALAEDLPSPAAARMAVRRATIRLSSIVRDR